MPNEYRRTDEFQGALFKLADLSGAVFRECDLRHVRVTGSDLDDVRLDAFAGELGSVFVEGVEVSGYVLDELDRRFPERVVVRTVRTADEYRAAWALLESKWAETLAHAERLPEPARFEGVDGEWSVAETVRHLRFAVDVWVGQMLVDEPEPFHPLGRPNGEYPAEAAAAIGIDASAEPDWVELRELFEGSTARVRAAMSGVDDPGLEVMRDGVPAPVWGRESHTVGECLRVLLNEFTDHRRYTERDLALLEAGK